MFVLLIFIQFFPHLLLNSCAGLSIDVQQCPHIPHCWSERGPCHFLRFLIFIATVISTRVTMHRELGGAGLQAGHLTWPFWHRPSDINRRTMDRALLLFPSAAANWRRWSLPPFLPFYFLSTRHNTQSTTVSKSHECPPFINCCLCTGVCIHPLYWHGVFSLFSFLRRTSSKKEVGTTKSCRTNDSGCACMEVMPPLLGRSNLLRLLRESPFLFLCVSLSTLFKTFEWK